MTGVGIVALALALAIVAPRWLPTRSFSLDLAGSVLDRRGALIVSVASIAVVWITWGSWTPRPQIDDEFSYVLQAKIFANGHWTAPRPPIPDFFQEPHVLVTPAVASKYPPGHALLLSLGAAVNFLPLVPLALTGWTAALLFALAKRIENVWVALLAWLIWISTPLVLRFQPSYFSELTSGAALLSAWWCLLRWRETGRRSWLFLLAFAIGWGAITRPLTMLALAVPIGVVVLQGAIRRRRLVELALSIAIALSVLAILPFWSVNTTGSWTVTPLGRYDRDYLPIDQLGFVPDTSPPKRVLLPPMQQLYNNILRLHREQPFAELPRTASSRARQLETVLASENRLPILLFIGIGIAGLTWQLGFGACSALLLFLAYLPYASADRWTIYDLEMAPVVATIVAAGMWRVSMRVAGERARAQFAAVLLALVLASVAIPEVMNWRGYHTHHVDDHFSRWLERLPTHHAIVFIRYEPGRYDYINVVHNYRDLTSARVWVVHDLGAARNAELHRVAPDRDIVEFDDSQVNKETSSQPPPSFP